LVEREHLRLGCRVKEHGAAVIQPNCHHGRVRRKRDGVHLVLELKGREQALAPALALDRGTLRQHATLLPDTVAIKDGNTPVIATNGQHQRPAVATERIPLDGKGRGVHLAGEHCDLVGKLAVLLLGDRTLPVSSAHLEKNEPALLLVGAALLGVLVAVAVAADLALAAEMAQDKQPLAHRKRAGCDARLVLGEYKVLDTVIHSHLWLQHVAERPGLAVRERWTGAAETVRRRLIALCFPSCGCSLLVRSLRLIHSFLRV
jgi:hypothetical protein